MAMADHTLWLAPCDSSSSTACARSANATSGASGEACMAAAQPITPIP